MKKVLKVISYEKLNEIALFAYYELLLYNEEQSINYTSRESFMFINMQYGTFTLIIYDHDTRYI